MGALPDESNESKVEALTRTSGVELGLDRRAGCRQVELIDPAASISIRKRVTAEFNGSVGLEVQSDALACDLRAGSTAAVS
jgi:hypothetical protein